MPKIAASERDAFYEARRSELASVALRLWAERGFDVVRISAVSPGIDDLDAIYELRSDDAAAALEAGVDGAAEAVVFSGSGLPTLAMLERAAERTGLPVLCSNASLAEALLERAPGTARNA